MSTATKPTPQRFRMSKARFDALEDRLFETGLVSEIEWFTKPVRIPIADAYPGAAVELEFIAFNGAEWTVEARAAG